MTLHRVAVPLILGLAGLSPGLHGQERGVTLADAIRLGPLDTPPQPPPTTIDGTGSQPATETTPPVPGEKAPRTLADAERAVILQALRHAEGRVSGPRGAAALLGLKPTTLHAKMKKLGVHRRDVLKG